MNYFLSGGAKNGKSSLAQQIVCAQGGPHYYLATMIPHDDEDRLRIRRHLENRAGLGFQTVECGTDILASLSQMDPDGAVLLDSVTALLSNEMFRADGTMDVLATAPSASLPSTSTTRFTTRRPRSSVFWRRTIKKTTDKKAAPERCFF